MSCVVAKCLLKVSVYNNTSYRAPVSDEPTKQALLDHRQILPLLRSQHRLIYGTQTLVQHLF
jgi:hypothetical protein